MKIKRNEFILYGLSKHREIIDKIIADLNAIKDAFDIRLIITEALTNAFKHGNKSDSNKPIYFSYTYDGNRIKFEIQDSGMGFENVTISDHFSDENLLNQNGRGLFLIKCIADKIELKNNTLIILKELNRS